MPLRFAIDTVGPSSTLGDSGACRVLLAPCPRRWTGWWGWPRARCAPTRRAARSRRSPPRSASRVRTRRRSRAARRAGSRRAPVRAPRRSSTASPRWTARRSRRRRRRPPGGAPRTGRSVGRVRLSHRSQGVTFVSEIYYKKCNLKKKIVVFKLTKM